MCDYILQLSCETFCTCIFSFRSSDYLFLGTSFQVGKIHECKIFNPWRTVWLFSFCMKQCIQCISFLNLFSFWFNRLHWQTMNSARIALCTGTSFQIWPILPELHAKTSQHFEKNSTANFAVYLLLIPDEIFSFPEKIASTINLWWMLFFQERRIFHLEIEHDCI